MPKTDQPIFIVLEDVLVSRILPARPMGDPVRGAQAFVAKMAEFGKVCIWSERVGRCSVGSLGQNRVHEEVRQWLALHKFPDVPVLYEFPKAGEGVFVGSRTVQCRPLVRDNGEFLPEFAFEDAAFETEKLVGLLAMET